MSDGDLATFERRATRLADKLIKRVHYSRVFFRKYVSANSARCGFRCKHKPDRTFNNTRLSVQHSTSLQNRVPSSGRAPIIALAFFSTLANLNTVVADDDGLATALMLADVLRAARTEIASQQPAINNELVGDKGLSGDVVLKRILARLDSSGKLESLNNPVDDRETRLFQAQLDSIREILDENQTLINKKGIGFKGFVPAVFAQLTNERFGEKVGDVAEIKVTAPIELVRNRKARPDQWESNVIESRFKSAEWSRGRLFSEIADGSNGLAFRVMVPEYYGQACLACHGSPKGEMDVTGYPKEGGKLDELGGSISITLYQ